jgi:Rho GTPase-activating protein RGD1
MLIFHQEFAQFLTKRSKLEEEHSNGLRKLCRSTAENIRRPDHRHGSFLQSYEATNIIHERMAAAGEKFSVDLQHMHDELLDQTAAIDRGRKQWKATGLAAESRYSDAESALAKSKAKYYSLAEDYDRARTGDRQSGKKFGLKGPKSAQQHEEDLLRKVTAADADYQAKVQAAQGVGAELRAKHRPEAVKQLKVLIAEVDSATTLQMQRYGKSAVLCNNIEV